MGEGGHICSYAEYECSACGHVESRDAFEGFVQHRDGVIEFYVCCPKCEHESEDQSNWDDLGDDVCLQCEEEGIYD